MLFPFPTSKHPMLNIYPSIPLLLSIQSWRNQISHHPRNQVVFSSSKNSSTPSSLLETVGLTPPCSFSRVPCIHKANIITPSLPREETYSMQEPISKVIVQRFFCSFQHPTHSNYLNPSFTFTCLLHLLPKISVVISQTSHFLSHSKFSKTVSLLLSAFKFIWFHLEIILSWPRILHQTQGGVVHLLAINNLMCML